MKFIYSPSWPVSWAPYPASVQSPPYRGRSTNDASELRFDMHSVRWSFTKDFHEEWGFPMMQWRIKKESVSIETETPKFGSTEFHLSIDATAFRFSFFPSDAAFCSQWESSIWPPQRALGQHFAFLLTAVIIKCWKYMIHFQKFWKSATGNVWQLEVSLAWKLSCGTMIAGVLPSASGFIWAAEKLNDRVWCKQKQYQKYCLSRSNSKPKQTRQVEVEGIVLFEHCLQQRFFFWIWIVSPPGALPSRRGPKASKSCPKKETQNISKRLETSNGLAKLD